MTRRTIYDHKVEQPPDYKRVVLALTDAELEDEILAKRGEVDYQLALLAEHERRGKEST